jgi:hypothetical protein
MEQQGGERLLPLFDIARLLFQPKLNRDLHKKVLDKLGFSPLDVALIDYDSTIWYPLVSLLYMQKYVMSDPKSEKCNLGTFTVVKGAYSFDYFQNLCKALLNNNPARRIGMVEMNFQEKQLYFVNDEGVKKPFSLVSFSPFIEVCKIPMYYWVRNTGDWSDHTRLVLPNREFAQNVFDFILFMPFSYEIIKDADEEDEEIICNLVPYECQSSEEEEG